jgi:hypothetical protein
MTEDGSPMRRVLDLRIVRWELKLAYVVGAWVVGFSLSSLLQALYLPYVVIDLLLGWALNLAVFYVGTRIFRGRGEPIEPPRPWWKMTARPTLSRRLGILFVFGVVCAFVLGILSVAGIDPSPREPTPLVYAIDAALFYGVLAFFYLNSAVRLKRAGVQPLEPVFRPKKLKLK